jgi:hypothetical protein
MIKCFNNSQKIFQSVLAFSSHLKAAVYDDYYSPVPLPLCHYNISSIENIFISSDDEYILVHCQTQNDDPDIYNPDITIIYYTPIADYIKIFKNNTLGVIKICDDCFIIGHKNIYGIENHKNYGQWTKDSNVNEVAVLGNKILYCESNKIRITYVNDADNKLKFNIISYSCDEKYGSPTWINENTFLFAEYHSRNKIRVFNLDDNDNISIMRNLEISGVSGIVHITPKITVTGGSVYMQYGGKIIRFANNFKSYSKHSNTSLPPRLEYCKYDDKFYDLDLTPYTILAYESITMPPKKAVRSEKIDFNICKSLNNQYK